MARIRYNITSSEAYFNSLSTVADSVIDSALLTEAYATPTEPTDTAIYVIGRLSNENSSNDRLIDSGVGAYYLSSIEKANLKLLADTYKNLVVVLNNCGVMDTTFARDMNNEKPGSVDALFIMGQAGMEGGTALVNVLNGTVSPSGKLADTYASKYEYYPASATFSRNDGNALQEDYVEGIYVGYRYFDSFYKSDRLNPSDPASVVYYPFGFGLSYTDFDIEVKSVTANMEYVTVEAAVANTGNTYSGKEVVEVYFSAPTGKLDKPYQELAGYGKTDVLAPGETQTLTISFQTTEMSSFDEDLAAYTMEKGDYIIRVGNSSRNTHVAAVLTLAEDLITEQLSTQLDDQDLYGRECLDVKVTLALANPDITWTSNNPAVAAVDANGVVTGVKAGNAIITATSDNGKVSKTTVRVN